MSSILRLPPIGQLVMKQVDVMDTKINNNNGDTVSIKCSFILQEKFNISFSCNHFKYGVSVVSAFQHPSFRQ